MPPDFTLAEGRYASTLPWEFRPQREGDRLSTCQRRLSSFGSCAQDRKDASSNVVLLFAARVSPATREPSPFLRSAAESDPEAALAPRAVAVTGSVLITVLPFDEVGRPGDGAVPAQGFEPRLEEPKSSVLPLDDAGERQQASKFPPAGREIACSRFAARPVGSAALGF
jgi:hypothetical protein